MKKLVISMVYLILFSLSACIQDDVNETSTIARDQSNTITTINLVDLGALPTHSGGSQNATSTQTTDILDAQIPVKSTDPTDPTEIVDAQVVTDPIDPTEIVDAQVVTEPTDPMTNTVKSLPKISILDLRTELGYSLSQYSSRDLSGRVTYMIGVYETRSDHGFDFHPTGFAHVEIEAQRGPIALILSSYEPSTWHLTGPGVAQINSLIFLGYHTQTVVATDLQVQAQSFNIDQNQYIASIYQWPAQDAVCVDPFQVPFDQYDSARRVCDGIAVQDFIRAQIAEEIDAFSGTYVATEFLIHSTVEN